MAGLGTLKKKTKVINTCLGLDMSTNSVAFCLSDKNGPVRWGVIEFKGKNTFERLADCQDKIRAAFKGITPDVICFEGATYVQNRRTVILLSMAYGSILGSIMKPGVEVYDVPAITWQNWLGNPAFTRQEKATLKTNNPTMTANQLKEKMREMRKQRTADIVEQRHGIKTTNNDLSDAIAVSLYGWNAYGTK